MTIIGPAQKTFTLQKLANNPSAAHQKLTLEFTSNPAWQAVKALPYLMEYPHECAEQLFNRFYANAIGQHIVESNPKIKQTFQVWATLQPQALKSPLETNQELKQALIEETPWVRDAQSEDEQRQRIALFFDLVKLTTDQQTALDRLRKLQSPNGGFMWFAGMPDDLYITQYLVSGFGHLRRLGADEQLPKDLKAMMNRAIAYTDDRTAYEYERLKRSFGFSPENNYLSAFNIQYLYARSFFVDRNPIPKASQEAYNFWIAQCEKYWMKMGNYEQAQIALAFHRLKKDSPLPDLISRSLKERSRLSEELGRYWNREEEGWWWYRAPIETQAMTIELFTEVKPDLQMVEEMKLWLLKQKQVQRWPTTRSTAEACYAVLLQGRDALADTTPVQITVGGRAVVPTQAEAGTGYFKTSWAPEQIKPEMATVKLDKKTRGPAWGALYWQYFETLDKITPPANNPLMVRKTMMVERRTDRGPELRPLTEGEVLTPGDLVKARIEIRVDRDMEYVHLKDMRAAGLEPTNVLSGYRYRDDLGFYESTRDMATHFFFGRINKGSYVLEIPMRVSQRGNFSNGICTLQCMYAPEFMSHSEGVRIQVK